MIFRPHPFRPLEKAIGYRFWRRSRLAQALSHPSFRHEQEDRAEDNQRLEFLGDAVLGLMAADHLYRNQPGATEGDMTKLRSLITSTKALATLAQSINLGSFLRLGKGELTSGGRQRPSILADAMEAVIGAAYLDGGLRAVQIVFATLFRPLLSEMEADPIVENPKGTLQERAQRTMGLNPRYVVTEETGPAHQRWYTVEVRLGDQAVGQGHGANKRMAETAAAVDALTKLSL